jgi:tetratricopeptide (TPR) repeat protein
MIRTSFLLIALLSTLWVKATDYYALAYEVYQSDTSLALTYLDKHISSSSGDSKATGYFMQGYIHDIHDRRIEAIKSYFEAVKLYKSKEQQANLYNKIGTLYFEGHSYRSALDFYARSFETYMELDHYLAVIPMRNMALCYKYRGNFNLSHKMLLQAKDITIANDDAKRTFITLRELGLLFQSVKQYSKALKYHTDALLYAQTSTDSSSCYVNIGYNHIQLGEVQAAIEISKEISSTDHSVIIPGYTNLGKAYLQQGDTAAAIASLDRVPEQSQVKYFDDLRYTWKTLRSLYEAQGQYQLALAYANKITDQLDPLLIAQEEMENQLKNFDSRMVELQLLREQEQQRYRRNMLVGLITGIMVVSLLIWLWIRYKKSVSKRNDNIMEFVPDSLPGLREKISILCWQNDQLRSDNARYRKLQK